MKKSEENKRIESLKEKILDYIAHGKPRTFSEIVHESMGLGFSPNNAANAMDALEAENKINTETGILYYVTE